MVQYALIVAFLEQEGWSPLMSASSNGYVEVVKTLIAAGANVNQGDEVSTRNDSCIYF